MPLPLLITISCLSFFPLIIYNLPTNILNHSLIHRCVQMNSTSEIFSCKICSLDHFCATYRTQSKSSREQYTNLQRTALLYVKGVFYASLTCSCIYLIPCGRKYPHKYRELSSGWTQKQGTLFLCQIKSRQRLCLVA